MNKKRIVQFCITCNKNIVNKHGRRMKFCSHACRIKYDYDNYIKRWKDGKEHGMRGYTVSGFIRRYMFIKYDNKCCKCGWSERNIKTNNIPLQINHIDGIHKNNKEENLELICPNCHSLTDTYGALNNGKGRMKRRQRYYEGKTF